MTEKEIINLYQQTGNVTQIGVLYKQYVHLVFGICMKYLKNTADAEDVTMEIFEILIKSLKTTTPVSFKSWLFTVSRNHCLQFLKKHSKENNLMNKISLEFIENESKESLIEEKLNLLDRAIASLNPSQRNAIVLFYFNNMSYKDICLKNNWSMNQTKSYIQNAKRALRIQMIKYLKNA